MPKIISINTSKKKGISKSPVEQGFFRKDLGLEGDAHAGPGERQVSLLAMEAINIFNQSLPTNTGKIKPGDFAENLTIEGMDFSTIKLGSQIKIGDVLLEISMLGKKCLRHCAIYKKLGSCIMPIQGVFARVINGGRIKKGDGIQKEK
ncbi:hypothetical protein AUJ66_06285 [Candidatus Desantisbacteria bacterium CG1_02_38_46]|uniref:MOSC domain-containing protein n=3 Tax=unclassified Candidatus Desantisiibacteriota TaxID=3106372 RepID=A0A2H9PAV7_9BACT|nr:MAG: hypothetical protein AUJ66_06285 [Candidatus Desantisbacteria bacterium CG1_02_38_46]PIU52275.1 MAG: MOSC domain-containing protein [Candidatus Desantisbacteria bacterium CG07_land_8_20_14_0_80_39_15]PIZ15672.1 MAG: MOSC domain-containing protein [Candidatus Desantisbacteria bacterium CG_4_10_14_0_8_um_filter_39_17]